MNTFSATNFKLLFFFDHTNILQHEELTKSYVKLTLDTNSTSTYVIWNSSRSVT